MDEKLHPQVPGDSHIPQEVVIGDGWWRLSTMGLLEMISRKGKPHLRENDETSEGRWIVFPVQHMIENLMYIAQGLSFQLGKESKDDVVQQRLANVREFVANVRAEWDGTL